MNKHLEYIESNPILKKTFEFGLSIINLCKAIRIKYKEYSLADQLLRSGTSIGANANEAVMGSSRKDFINKMNISLKEAYETRYWILLMTSAGYIANEEKYLDNLDELIRMLVKIVKTSKEKVEK
ncbi:MAG: four helix bundle protein [Saprospiraceae bacterium]|nr:four helix bundle protein [Saprospiraceae bacterium]